MSIRQNSFGSFAEGLVSGLERGQDIRARHYRNREIRDRYRGKKELEELRSQGIPEADEELLATRTRREQAYLPEGTGGVGVGAGAEQGVGWGVNPNEQAAYRNLTTQPLPTEDVIEEGERSRMRWRNAADHWNKKLVAAEKAGGDSYTRVKAEKDDWERGMLLNMLMEHRQGIDANDPYAMQDAIQQMADIKPGLAGFASKAYVDEDGMLRMMTGKEPDDEDDAVLTNKELYAAMSILPEVRDIEQALNSLELQGAQKKYLEALTAQADISASTATARQAMESMGLTGVGGGRGRGGSGGGAGGGDLNKHVADFNEEFRAMMDEESAWANDLFGRYNKNEGARGLRVRDAKAVQERVVAIGSYLMMTDPENLRTPSMVKEDAMALLEWGLGLKGAEAPKTFEVATVDGQPGGVGLYYPGRAGYIVYENNPLFQVLSEAFEWHNPEGVTNPDGTPVTRNIGDAAGPRVPFLGGIDTQPEAQAGAVYDAAVSAMTDGFEWYAENVAPWFAGTLKRMEGIVDRTGRNVRRNTMDPSRSERRATQGFINDEHDAYMSADRQRLMTREHGREMFAGSTVGQWLNRKTREQQDAQDAAAHRLRSQTLWNTSMLEMSALGIPVD